MAAGNVPEYLKILYGTLEKAFFTLLVMLGSLIAWLWISQKSLTQGDAFLVVSALLVLSACCLGILLKMQSVFRSIREKEL